MASAHDLAEIARSASEASKIKFQDVDLTRYQSPPADTCYPLEYAFHLLGDVRDKVVLDLGCGSGEEIVPLRQRGAKVIGIDISPDLIDVARQRLQKYDIDAELQVRSAYETQLPDKSVDVVFCMSILHHLQLDRVKSEIRRVLKPDGKFIFKEPVRFSRTMSELRPLFPSKEDISDFEHPLDCKEMEALVEGFEVLASRSFRSPLVPLFLPLTKKRPLGKHIWRLDASLLRKCSFLAHFATVRVMALQQTESCTPAVASQANSFNGSTAA